MKVKQLFCKHIFKVKHNERLIGVTLNWSLQPTNEYEDDYKCSKCGFK